MKRALIVGINYAGTGSALKGCLNDAANMQSFLAGRGFSEIKSVLEKEATTAGIIAGLNWLIADTKPGDVILFHYSGHGSQLVSSVEPDGYEEIICPIDLNWIDKVITDDTLRQIFDKVPNGVNTTLILDCCHSGTMLDQTGTLGSTRTVEASAPTKGSRYLKPPAKIKKQLDGCTLVNWETSRDVNATALLIAGCHASQTAADAFIDGIYQGAATASLLKATAVDSAISYRSLVTNMQSYMVENKFKQIPQLDGSESLYDQKFLQPFSFAIPPSVNTAPDPVVASDEKKSNGKKMMALAMLAVAVIAFIIFMAG